jgi:hypothetical protein
VLSFLVLTSIVWYYVWLFLPIATTNCVQTCAASQLWKVTVVGSLLCWLVFIYIALGSKRHPLLFNSFFSILLALELVMLYMMAVAPETIAAAFGEAYDITYVNSLEFSFASGMILLLTIISAVMSFNVGIAFPVRARISESGLWKQLKLALLPAARNCSIYVGFTLFLKNAIDFLRPGAGNDQLFSFTILMAANMLIPILHPILTRLRKVDITILGIIGLSCSIPDLANFLTGRTFPLSAPFVVFAFYSSICVCISSALGELAYKFVDLRSLREKRLVLQFVTASLTAVLVVGVTWFLSHALIFV